MIVAGVDEVGRGPLAGPVVAAAVILPKKNELSGIFADSGQVFASTSDFDVGDVRLSLGGGFHWFSPVGPISLTYAFPINDEAGDDTKKFQFTLGSLVR